MGRALGGALVLGAEYLALALRFDGGVLTSGHDWWAAFGRVGGLVSISVAVFTAGLLVRGADAFARLKAITTDLPRPELRWALAHAGAFGVFTLATSRLFGPNLPGSPAILLAIGAWFASGGLCLATLFRFTFGPAWRPVLGAVSGLFVAGLALGLVAWFAGVRSVPLWRSLASSTLTMSGWMLRPFVDSVRVVPEELLLGIDDFDVTIDAPCSGMENLGAVLVFLLGYLYTFRERIRLAQSLFLVPVALVAVWLVNCVRIAALVAIGAYFSPAVALGGFHSKAGWLALCLVALSVVFVTRNSPRFSRTAPEGAFTESATAAYLAPLLTWVGVGLVTGLFSRHVDWLYPLRVVAAGAVAWHYRREYPAPVRRVSLSALALGIVAFGLWLVLVAKPDASAVTEHERELASASAWLSFVWLAFRVAGTVLVVPIVEELAFRGFLQRRLIAEDFTSESPATFTWPSFVVSALAFGLLHESWLAGTVAGASYSLACYRAGRLEDAFVAHATTNGLLAFAALVLGQHNLLQ